MKRQTLLIAALLVALFNLLALATVQSILASSPTRIAQAGTGTKPPLLTGTPYRTYTVIAPFNATPTAVPQQRALAPNRAALESFYTSLPPSMAGLRVVTYDQRFDAQTSMVSFALEGKNGERFTVRIEIYESEALAYDRFRFFEQVMIEGHSAGIGTESLVAPDNLNRLGAMRYGNVLVALLRNSITADGEKVESLNERAIVEILQAVYERIRKF